MNYIKADESHIDSIFQLVQTTIKTIYPKYYPKEVVDFFCNLHSKENIATDIKNGCVSALIVDGQIVGTGSYKENHITRVYVLPEFQGCGYGSYIMQKLENEISEVYNKISSLANAQGRNMVYLDASLPACRLYEHRGYKTKSHKTWKVDNGAVLVYEVMEKDLLKATIRKMKTDE